MNALIPIFSDIVIIVGAVCIAILCILLTLTCIAMVIRYIKNQKK